MLDKLISGRLNGGGERRRILFVGMRTARIDARTPGVSAAFCAVPGHVGHPLAKQKDCSSAGGANGFVAGIRSERIDCGTKEWSTGHNAAVFGVVGSDPSTNHTGP